jgi:hypothetical protein
MIPKLMINKNNKKNIFKELLEISYNRLKSNNYFYHYIFHFYKNPKTNNLATKIYTIYPNINFEFKQIKNLSFSNTNLNKYLINSKYKLPKMEKNKNENKDEEEEYKSGFFTMSQNHRLIALKDDLKEDVNKSQSLKEIIIGIWINIKEEKPTPKKGDLDFYFNKYKYLIYKECFRFIQLSNNIETIYSPSPEENIFLLVIFYKGMQCHYEVKMTANNNNINNNQWLICKFKYELEEQKHKVPFDFDIKIEINHGAVRPMMDYLNKKIKIKNILDINNNKNNEAPNIHNNNDEDKASNANNANNNEEIKKYKEININVFNNVSDDVYNLSDNDGDSNYGGYNYPLAVPNLNKNNSNNNIIKSNQNKIDKIDNISYKKQHEISRASTNEHSNKLSMTSSKNSGKNNNSNVDIINHNNEEENLIDNIELINQYTSTIMKNSESIKKLENQINSMEKNIMEIINQLEKSDKKSGDEKRKKTKKKDINKNDDLNNNKADKVDVSNIGDVSINVPRIIYKELSVTTDEL